MNLFCCHCHCIVFWQAIRLDSHCIAISNSSRRRTRQTRRRLLPIHQIDMIERILYRHECTLSLFLGIELAFPNSHHMPPHPCQLMLHLNISLLIAHNLLTPKLHMSLRRAILVTILMTMPKATIHKDTRTILAKHNVRRAWQSAIVHTITEAAGKEIPPHHHLWLRILGMNRSHYLATLLLCQLCHIPILPLKYKENRK